MFTPIYTNSTNPAKMKIDENATINEAIHKMVMWQTLSIIVSRGEKVVGILRLSDLFDHIAKYIIGQE